MAYWESWHSQNSLLKHFQLHSEIISSIDPYSDMFGTLHNPCIYNCALFKTLAYLVPDSSSKVCWTCHMIMHIQNPCIEQFIQTFSRIFTHIQRYWCTSSQKHRCATRGRGEASPVCFENQKQCSDFEKKFSDCVHLWVKFSINPLQPSVAYLYPLKTLENLEIFGCFKGL